MAAEQEAIIHVLISLAVLLFAAKIFAEIFNKLRLPAVLGELIAGIVVGPFALGSIPIVDGKAIVILNETVLQIGQISGIVILFIAGLAITPKEFLRGGGASFTIGACGVIVPFLLGYYVFTLYGLDALESVLIATALTATSVAISVSVLTEFGKMQTKEAKVILGAAIVDDILAIAVLSVVVTMVQTGNLAPNIIDIIILILKILGIFAGLLLGAIIIIPRIVNTERLWKARGSVEGIVTASFFGASAIAAAVGLSPIVGSFSVGMAVASTKIIKRVEEYVDKLEIIFGPLFFAIIGAQVNLTGVNIDVLILSAIVIVIAIVSKLLGCGLPSLLFLRDKSKAMIVGIGMISRGEVGLIVAGIGVTSGVLSSNIYTTVIIMVAVTTLITPMWLRKAYAKAEVADTRL
ncbi:MAG: cation:proton antiporter [Nitrososphaeraceae archaeon]|nr:cation:proton antiporter [Nitrososphaeraceae archaeon]MDW0282961.1 cation:proton antiporter [Nitrososphaeraceae archaeon]MDW0315932.1 cation:proton antiporter [Nitrososphaeraceae archaeon]MDW0333411.1 cation:proton antiporter [Nitrososphaeraceae archaeon]